MHNENSSSKSLGPLFLNMYVLKLDFVQYEYTYTYHANDFCQLYAYIKTISKYDSMHI
jgi:hypothetical protein